MDNEKTFTELKELYLQSMNKSEKVAYKIAVESLETSYDMIKTIGFLKFVKDNQYIIVDEKDNQEE